MIHAILAIFGLAGLFGFKAPVRNYGSIMRCSRAMRFTHHTRRIRRINRW